MANVISEKEMLEVAEIIKEVGGTSSRNDKIAILEQNKNNTILQNVFTYSYSPYKRYGIGEKSLENAKDASVDIGKPNHSNIFELLDYLNTVNINDDIRNEVFNFLNSTHESLKELYKRMILKDLRVGATGTIANQAFGRAVVPKFDLMQGRNYYDRLNHLEGEKIVISTKLDGERLVIIKREGEIELRARSGRLVEGCIEIEEDAQLLPDNYVYDGEILSKNPKSLPSKDLFTETRKIMGSKGDKVGLEFHMFDALPLGEFERGESSKSFLERKKWITNLINTGRYNSLKNVPVLYVGYDLDEVDIQLKKAIANGEEGVMVNLNKTYECKRSNNLLKVKQFHTVDLKVIGFEEGTGRNKGKLGSFKVDYKGYHVNVGSGLTDKEREQIWENKEKCLGRVIEVQYFEESKSGGELSLRFPTFIRFREKGKEVSYN